MIYVIKNCVIILIGYNTGFGQIPLSVQVSICDVLPEKRKGARNQNQCECFPCCKLSVCQLSAQKFSDYGTD